MDYNIRLEYIYLFHAVSEKPKLYQESGVWACSYNIIGPGNLSACGDWLALLTWFPNDNLPFCYSCLSICMFYFVYGVFFFLSLDEKWYLHISEGSGRCWELIGVTYIKLQNINGAIRKRRQLTWNLWTDIRSIMGSFKNSNKETE